MKDYRVLIFFICALFTGACKKSSNEYNSNEIKYPISIKFSNFQTSVTPMAKKSKLSISTIGSNSSLDVKSLMDEGYSNFDLVIYDKNNKKILKEFFGYYYKFNDYKLELPIGDYTAYISVSKPVNSADGDRLLIDTINKNFYDYSNNLSKDVLISKSQFSVSQSNNILQFSLYRPAGFISINIEDLAKKTSAVSSVRLSFKKPQSISMDNYVINSLTFIDGFKETISLTSLGSENYIHNFFTPYLVNDESSVSEFKIELLKNTGSNNIIEVVKSFDVPTFKIYRNKITTITGKLFDDESTNNKSIGFSFKINEPELTEITTRFN